MGFSYRSIVLTVYNIIAMVGPLATLLLIVRLLNVFFGIIVTEWIKAPNFLCVFLRS